MTVNRFALTDGLQGWTVESRPRTVCAACHCDMDLLDWGEHLATERHRLRRAAHEALEAELRLDPRTR